MKINIQNTDSKDAQKLLGKFLELNEASREEYDYIDNDNLIIGTNERTNIAYIYIEDTPSLSICLDAYTKDFMLIYSSGLDGMEFVTDLDVNSMSKLEDVFSIAYDLDEKRGGDYEDEAKNEQFEIDMLNAGWNTL